jgi:hypothetical protein
LNHHLEEQDQQDSEDTEANYPGRWQVLRDVLAFQFKLAMDGLRDLLLSPVSIIAALVGVFSDRSNPGRYFYQLLYIGRRSDRWINLFGEHEAEGEELSADQLIRNAEQAMREQYTRGGVVSQIKEQTDKAIDKVHERREPGDTPSVDQEPGSR